MGSSRTRQRKLARAKLDRQMARRAATARRKRQVRAGVGASLALLLIVFGSIWLFGGFDDDEKTPAAADVCSWSPQNAEANANLKEVGTPPTTGLATSGTADMTITTNQGVVQVALDATTAPCATASFSFLAGQGFFGSTSCHELLTGDGGMKALRCGDPSGTGTGGPTYTFYDENVPSAPTPDPSTSASASASPAASTPLYPKGTVAMATDTPGANGSQFFIFYADSTPESGQYSIIGTVTSGLEVVEKIAKAGTVENSAGEKTKPKLDVTIENLTVTGPASPTPAASEAPATATPEPSGAAGATATATASSAAS